MIPKLPVGTLRKGNDGRTSHSAQRTPLSTLSGPRGQSLRVGTRKRKPLRCAPGTDAALHQPHPAEVLFKGHHKPTSLMTTDKKVKKKSNMKKSIMYHHEVEGIPGNRQLSQ